MVLVGGVYMREVEDEDKEVIAEGGRGNTGGVGGGGTVCGGTATEETRAAGLEEMMLLGASL